MCLHIILPLRTTAVMPAAALFLQDLLPGREMVGRFLRKLLEQKFVRVFDLPVGKAEYRDAAEATRPSVAYVLDGNYDESLGSLAFIVVPCSFFFLLLILKYLKPILAKIGEPVIILIRDSFATHPAASSTTPGPITAECIDTIHDMRREWDAERSATQTELAALREAMERSRLYVKHMIEEVSAAGLLWKRRAGVGQRGKRRRAPTSVTKKHSSTAMERRAMTVLKRTAVAKPAPAETAEQDAASSPSSEYEPELECDNCGQSYGEWDHTCLICGSDVGPTLY